VENPWGFHEGGAGLRGVLAPCVTKPMGKEPCRGKTWGRSPWGGRNLWSATPWVCFTPWGSPVGCLVPKGS
jgi:hypothetical protein